MHLVIDRLLLPFQETTFNRLDKVLMVVMDLAAAAAAAAAVREEELVHVLIVQETMAETVVLVGMEVQVELELRLSKVRSLPERLGGILLGKLEITLSSEI